MLNAPKALRLHIGIFGRTNVGKSTFLNYVVAQDVAITSALPGTTTDIVEKAIEFLPLGPVVFLDTAGIDDISPLANLRVERTKKAFARCDIFVLLTEPDKWGDYEKEIAVVAKKQNSPLIVIINKSDAKPVTPEFLNMVSIDAPRVMACSSTDNLAREKTIAQFKRLLIENCPSDFLNPPALIGDLLPTGGLAVLVVPIDLEAPKGRLILPQVQAIRDLLDNDAAALVVKERELKIYLQRLGIKPDLVICDSQVVLKMVADTPLDIKCTTFSILFARNKGDLVENARAAKVIDNLKPGDKVLIAESCSHHPIEDDIGRVKIPRWLTQYVGGKLDIVTCAGADYPDNLKEFKLVIHCGGCMMNRRQVLARIQKAKEAGVPVTNYGVAISFVQGVLERVLSPFPAALEAFRGRDAIYGV